MIPVALRVASSSIRWVNPAGCWIRVSTEPRLTAGVISLTFDIRAAAAAWPPLASKEISVPGPHICVPTSSALRTVPSPG